MNYKYNIRNITIQMSRTKQVVNNKSSKNLKKEVEEEVEDVEETLEEVEDVEETVEVDNAEEVEEKTDNTNKKTSIFDKINREEIAALEEDRLSDISNETLLQVLYLRGLNQQNPTIYHTARKALDEMNLTLIPRKHFSTNHRNQPRKFNGNYNNHSGTNDRQFNNERFTKNNERYVNNNDNHYERRKPGTSENEEENVRKPSSNTRSRNVPKSDTRR